MKLLCKYRTQANLCLKQRYRVQELAILPLFSQNILKVRFPLIMYTFLVMFRYFQTMGHLNDPIKASLDLYWTYFLDKPQKTKVSKVDISQ